MPSTVLDYTLSNTPPTGITTPLEGALSNTAPGSIAAASFDNTVPTGITPAIAAALSNTPPAGITPALAAAGTASAADPVTLAVTPDNTSPAGITPPLAGAGTSGDATPVTLSTTPDNTAPTGITSPLAGAGTGTAPDTVALSTTPDNAEPEDISVGGGHTPAEPEVVDLGGGPGIPETPPGPVPNFLNEAETDELYEKYPETAALIIGDGVCNLTITDRPRVLYGQIAENTTFTAIGYAAGRSATIYLRGAAQGGGTSTLTFPNGWIWASAQLSSLPEVTVGTLRLRCTSDQASGVYAEWLDTSGGGGGGLSGYDDNQIYNQGFDLDDNAT